jgi:hypothetical protein
MVLLCGSVVGLSRLARHSRLRFADRAEKPWTEKLWIYDLPPSTLRRDRTHQQTLHAQRKFAKAPMRSSCPASLDTLEISVPPAVKLDAACGARPALDLDDFVACYNPKNRHERKESERFNPDKSGANRLERPESERFRSFTYEELNPTRPVTDAQATAGLSTETSTCWIRCFPTQSASRPARLFRSCPHGSALAQR